MSTFQRQREKKQPTQNQKITDNNEKKPSEPSMERKDRHGSPKTRRNRTRRRNSRSRSRKRNLQEKYSHVSTNSAPYNTPSTSHYKQGSSLNREDTKRKDYRDRKGRSPKGRNDFKCKLMTFFSTHGYFQYPAQPFASPIIHQYLELTTNLLPIIGEVHIPKEHTTL